MPVRISVHLHCEAMYEIYCSSSFPVLPIQNRKGSTWVYQNCPLLAGGVTSLLSELLVVSLVTVVSLLSSVVVLVLLLEQAARNRTAAKKQTMFFMLLLICVQVTPSHLLKKAKGTFQIIAGLWDRIRHGCPGQCHHSQHKESRICLATNVK